MIETDAHLPGWEQSTQTATPSPVPPIEQQLITALLACDSLRAKAVDLFTLLRTQPRDGEAFQRLQHEALAAWSAAGEAYWAYHAVISCKGQA